MRKAVHSARAQRRHEQKRLESSGLIKPGWRVAFTDAGFYEAWTAKMGIKPAYRVLLSEDTKALDVPLDKCTDDFVKELREARKNEKMAEKLGKTLPKADFSAPRSRL